MLQEASKPRITLTGNIVFFWCLPLAAFLIPAFSWFPIPLPPTSFFFSFFFFTYFWLCWVFVAARGLSLVAVSGGATLRWGAWAYCGGFSLQSTGSRLLGFSSCSARASVVVAHRLSSCDTGLVALRHVESSWTRDWTHVPCIGKRIPNHCATTPYFFDPSSLKVTHTEGFPRYLAKINGSCLQFSQQPIFASDITLIRICPGLIYTSHIYWGKVICWVLCWVSVLPLVPALPRILNFRRPSSHAPPNGLEVCGPSGACSSRALVSFPKSHTWDSRITCLNPHWICFCTGLLPWSFLQRADLPLVCSLLGPKGSCYCSRGEGTGLGYKGGDPML